MGALEFGLFDSFGPFEMNEFPAVVDVYEEHIRQTQEGGAARVSEAEPNLLMGFLQGGELIARTRIGFGPQDREVLERSTPERKELARVFQECTRSYDFWIDNGLAIVGSPDTVIRKIEEQQRLAGYNVFAARHRIGRLAPELAHKSMRLFAEHVIPAFS